MDNALIQRWVQLMREHGVDEEDLEDLVLSAAERYAAIAARHEADTQDEADDIEQAFDAGEQINHEGMARQLYFLVDQLGEVDAREHIETELGIRLN